MDNPHSVFAFPDEAHVLLHGPVGYENYESFKAWLRDEFSFRCVYCLTRERWYPNGQDAFSVDHYLPKATYPSLETQYDNLRHCCLRCNSFKRLSTEVLDPCQTALGLHLRINASGEMEALTPAGRAHIKALALNAPLFVQFRHQIIEMLREMKEESNLLRWLGHPRDLEDLSRLRPPRGNTRPEGVTRSAFARRARNELSETY